MPDAQHSLLERAREALESLPATADRDDILATIHRRLTIDRDVRSAENLIEARETIANSGKSSWWSEWMGCLIPALLIPALFIAMPLLFSIGERIMARPARTTATGTIKVLEYSDGKLDESVVGLKCRITPEHVLIESKNGETIVVPNDSYRRIQLNTDKSSG
jgi:hypothetical protein